MLNTKFQKLSPEILSDIKGYREALDYVFSEVSITNIAITGPFGAGKSSIVETYKSLHKEKNIISISLAAFNSNEYNESSNSDSKSSNLEGKIINQLIHQINLKMIPLSNYKIKRSLSRIQHFLNTVLVMFFFIFPVYISNLDLIKLYMDNSSFTIIKASIKATTSYDGIFFLLILYIVVIGYFISMLFHHQIGKMLIKKLKIQGYEIEMHENSDATHFDKYLDEIMYILDNGKIDSIIFEDIDRRSESVELFSKLRELNYIVNKKGKRVKFFYLIRDDIFNNKDRTKFFDFILPIVPIVDSSNSYDKIIEIFKASDVLSDFNSKYLQDISFYIDDMRLLKNIHNEYIIYKKRLFLTEKNFDKLLSLIVFKNMFPEDFLKLQLNQGFMYSIFCNKSMLIETETDKLKFEIDSLRDELLSLETEKLRDLDELDAVYLNFGEILINGVDSLEYGTRRELISIIKQTINGIYTKNTSTIIPVEDSIQKLSKNEEYIRRRDTIIKINENTKIVLQEELENKLNKLATMEHNKVADLLNRDNIDDYFINISKLVGESYSDRIVKNHYFPLIKYLVRNSFVDESYANYLTYFYENSLCLSDKNFIISILNKKKKDFAYDLVDIEKIIDKLNVLDFDNEEVLNYQLTDYVFSNNRSYSVRLLSQLKRTKNFEFYTKYFEYTSFKIVLINLTVELWPEFLYEMRLSKEVFEFDKKRIIYYILQNVDNEDVETLNYENTLNTYISTIEKFESLEINNVVQFLNNIARIDGKFSQLSFENLDRKILEGIYELSLYEINHHMVNNIFEYALYQIYDQDYRSYMYTIVFMSKNNSFIEYIHNNIDRFTEVIIESCTGLITDSENIAIKLINNENISISLKEKYIQYFEGKFEYLESIDSSMWNLVVEYRKVIPCAKNIIDYYLNIGSELNQPLKDLLNSELIDIDSFKSAWEEYQENFSIDFLHSLILSNGVSDVSIIGIVNTYPYKIPIVNRVDINSEIIRKLIMNETFSYNEKSELIVRENFKDVLYCFISQNISEYISQYENDIPESDVYDLLLMDEISTEFKLLIVENFNGNISIINHNFESEVMDRILTDHFITEELLYILDIYDQYNDTVKSRMLNLLGKNINKIQNIKKEIPLTILLDLLSSNLVDINIKSDLIAKQSKYSDLLILSEMFKSANIVEFVNLLSGDRPKIKISSYNNVLMSILKDKGYITSYTEDERHEYYRFRLNTRVNNNFIKKN